MTRAVEVPNAPEFLRVPYDVLYDFRKDQQVVRVDFHLSSSTSMCFRAVTDAQHEGNPMHFLDADVPLIVGITNLDQIVDKDADLPSSSTIATASGFRLATSTRRALRADR
jgi:hypothetical protein